MAPDAPSHRTYRFHQGGAISRGPKVGVVDIDQVDRLSISLPEGIA